MRGSIIADEIIREQRKEEIEKRMAMRRKRRNEKFKRNKVGENNESNNISTLYL